MRLASILCGLIGFITPINAALSFSQITSSAPWGVRSELSLTQLRSPVTYNTTSGTINGQTNGYVVYAGRGMGSFLNDDVWYSTNGLDWQLVSGASIASSRPYSLSPGSTQCSSPYSNKMVMLSGHGPGSFYEISADGGSTWTRFGPSPSQGFQARAYSGCVFDPSDAMILLGGWLYSTVTLGDTVVNDVWQKSNSLSSDPFSLVTASSSWSSRDGHMVASYYSETLDRNLIYVIGGRAQNHQWSSGNTTGSCDIWISSDNGASFISLGNGPFGLRGLGRLSASSSGVLMLTGGESDQFNPPNTMYGDVIVSLDGGLTWGVCDLSSSRPSPRRLHGVLIDHENYLWIAGGEDDRGKFNDVWKLQTSVDDLATLARECSLDIPCEAGLQCWPTDSCTRCTVTPSSSSTGSSAAQSSSASTTAQTGSSSSAAVASSSSAIAGGVELEEDSGSSSLNGGVIAGIVIACIIGLLLLWLLLVWCHTRRRQHMPSPSSMSSSHGQHNAQGLQIATYPHVGASAFSASELDTPDLQPRPSSSIDSSNCSTWPSSQSSIGIETSEV